MAQNILGMPDFGNLFRTYYEYNFASSLGARSDSLLEMMDNRTLLMDDLCRIDSNCFIVTFRSVYKELHADRETGC